MLLAKCKTERFGHFRVLSEDNLFIGRIDFLREIDGSFTDKVL